MYESFYGLKEKPFTMLPDPGFLYLSKKHQKALTLFEYGLMNHAGFCVISGEIGSGKTTLLRKLLENMNRKIAVGMITNTHKGFGNLLDWVLSAFDIHEKGLNDVEKHQRFVDFLIEQYASKKTTLLIVDEAQNMAADKLEELRMLSNINADKNQILQIILAGQPELKDTLNLPELKQFVQRIAVDYHLDALDQDDTRNYIAHRLSVAGADHPIFTEAASDLIYKYSGGTPRLINLLCDTAMVYGFADQQDEVDEDLVVEMILERMQGSLVPLACTEMPKKKAGKRVSAKKIADRVAAPQTDVAETAERKNEPTDLPGSKSRPEAAGARESAADESPAEEAKVPAHADVMEEPLADQGDSRSVPTTAPSEPEENSPAASIAAQRSESSRSGFLQPMLIALLGLVMATLFFALSLEDDEAGRNEAVLDGQSSEQPGLVDIGTPNTELSSDRAQAQSASIKLQLDETQAIQQEMAERQLEDRARMKMLEEQATQMQNERDAALASAQAEKAKRAAGAEAARIAAEREQEAQAVAQMAIAEAMAAAKKVELMEEIKANEARLQDELERLAALEAEQKKIEAANEVAAAEAELAKVESDRAAAKSRVDPLCEGTAARFLSTCR